MKFQVMMKTPDAQERAIDSALVNFTDFLTRETEKTGITVFPEDVEELLAEKRDELTKFTNTWFKHGEYVIIEFDTEAKTATILSV